MAPLHVSSKLNIFNHSAVKVFCMDDDDDDDDDVASHWFERLPSDVICYLTNHL